MGFAKILNLGKDLVILVSFVDFLENIVYSLKFLTNNWFNFDFLGLGSKFEGELTRCSVRFENNG